MIYPKTLLDLFNYVIISPSISHFFCTPIVQFDTLIGNIDTVLSQIDTDSMKGTLDKNYVD